MSTSEFLAVGVLTAFVVFNLRAVFHLSTEIRFYRNHNWDLHQDSGNRYFATSFKNLPKFIPVGVLKMWMLSMRVVMCFLPFIAMYNGYVLRNSH